MAQENNEHAVPSSEGESPPKRSGHQSTGVAPISAIQAPQATGHRPSPKQKQRNRFGDLAKVAAGIAVACIIIYLAKRNGVFTPDWIQTALTLILAVWAGMQWLTYHRQWKVMQNQYTAMRRQIKMARLQLRQAAKASEQTNEIIQHMRMEQRAWLSARPEIIGDIQPNQYLKCQLLISNTGKTPGNITRTVITTFKAGVPIDFDAVLFHHATQSTQQPRENVIPPSGTTRYVFTTAPFLDADEVRDINDGKMSIVVIANIDYTDAIDRPHETQVCYTYDIPSKSLFTYEKYNYMK